MDTKPMLITHLHQVKILVGSGDTAAVSRVIQLLITPITSVTQLQTIKKLERPSSILDLVTPSILDVDFLSRCSTIIDFSCNIFVAKENAPIPELKPTKWKCRNVIVVTLRMSAIENVYSLVCAAQHNTSDMSQMHFRNLVLQAEIILDVQRESVTNLILQHHSVFSDIPGRCNKFEVKITLTTFLTDKGAQFTSEIWSTGLTKMGSRHTSISLRYPQSNPNEQFMRELAHMLRILCHSKQQSWRNYLPAIENLHNNIMHESTGQTPTEVLKGTVLRLPFPCLADKP
ncbi:hypothetical protein PR048_004285 [Dryococelus australis]|uniref:Integrase catalytic domain-containing protein n=1 Tax=Dryococelus australis TaxID=614101 RepID=A0ABQ9I667_9NEOP|nr:hypothetical protein PR048_004285 [Dryococelus australis]